MNIDLIESNFIFSLYKDIDLFRDYITKVDAVKHFEKEESIFYYNMGRELVKQGYNSIDQIAVATYLDDKPSLKTFFIQLGGWKELNSMIQAVEEKNVHKYWDDIVKLNMFKHLESQGMIVDRDKFKNATSNEVYCFYEHLINDAMISYNSEVKIDKFTATDEYLNNMNKGLNMGASIAKNCPRLNYDISDWHLGNLSILGGFSGSGKSNWCTSNSVIPLLEQGYQYTIISNEQVRDEFMNHVMTNVLANKFNYFKITRKRLLAGNFTKEEWEYLKKAQKFINDNYSEKLHFVKLFEYDIAETKKIVKKLANEGCSYFLYDTFKAEDSSDDNTKGLMIEYSKQLFQLASKLNIHILMTQQLAIYMENTRYLTSACLSMSKQVKEVADVVILMRNMWDDEYEEEKFDIKPYNFMRGSDGKYVKDGKGHGVKEEFTLSKDDKNLIMFLDKNRWGEDKKTYVYNFKGAWNVWEEKGYCHVHTKNRF